MTDQSLSDDSQDNSYTVTPHAYMGGEAMNQPPPEIIQGIHGH